MMKRSGYQLWDDQARWKWGIPYHLGSRESKRSAKDRLNVARASEFLIRLDQRSGKILEKFSLIFFRDYSYELYI